MGLTRLLASLVHGGVEWLNSNLGILATGIAGAAYILWWIRRSDGASERSAIVGPRSVTDRQRESLALALSKCAPQPILLVSFADPEACNFATDLQVALANATLDRSRPWIPYTSTHDDARSVTGVRVELSVNANETEKAAAKILSRWLQAENFSRDGMRRMSEHVTWRFMPNDPRIPIAIKVTVGTR